MITRRLFFIGSAAALAATQLPEALSAETPVVIPPRENYLHLWRLDFFNDWGAPSEVSLKRVTSWAGDNKLLECKVGTGGMLSWWAPPGFEIVVAPTAPITAVCSPWGKNASLHLFYQDPFSDKGPYVEVHGSDGLKSREYLTTPSPPDTSPDRR